MTATTKKAAKPADKDESLNLYQRLLAVTSAGGIAKTGKAADKIGGYAFHKIDDIEAHMQPLLDQHRVLALPTVAQRIDLAPKGNQLGVALLIEVDFINPDNPEEKLTRQSWGYGYDSLDKMTGKAFSYALKALYLAMFHLKGQPDNEDHAPVEDMNAPAQATAPPPQQPSATQQQANGAITEKQAKRLWAIAKSNDWNGDGVSDACYSEFGYQPREIPKGKVYDEIVAWFETTSPFEYDEQRKSEAIAEAAQPDPALFDDLESGAVGGGYDG
jgi:hypothetical protein